MKLIFAVKDNAVEAFGQPFFVRARGEAMRSFIDECNNEQGQMIRHPADYDLYFIGYYDEDTGKFEMPNDQNLPERVARAIDHVPTKD